MIDGAEEYRAEPGSERNAGSQTNIFPVNSQARSYVQARGGSCLFVPRHLNFFETQINVIRNCVKRKKNWQKESYKPVAVAVRLRSTPYVVTCNIFCVILFVADPDPNLRGPTSLPTCLLLTHVALCQRVRSVIRRTRYINVPTYLLTVIISSLL